MTRIALALFLAFAIASHGIQHPAASIQPTAANQRREKPASAPQ